MTLEDDTSKPSEFPPRLAGLIAAAALMPLFVIFVHFGKQNLGFVFLSITVAFLGVIYVNRSSALRWRFVAEVVALYIIHVVVIINLSLPQKIPGFVMIPISIADAVLVLGIIRLLDKVGKMSER